MTRIERIFLASAIFLSVSGLGLEAQDIHVTMLRAQFLELSFSGSDEQAEALAARCSDYFRDQLRGHRELVFSLGPAVTLDGHVGDYAQNDGHTRDYMMYDAVREACRKSDQEVDFSTTDIVVVMMAGPSEADGAGTEYFWPQSGALQDNGGAIILDGRTIDKFAVCTEISGDLSFSDAGTLCHELGHALGLPDWYDTDGEGSGGVCPALWGFTSLMDTGRRNGNGWTPAGFNAIEMDILGIGNPEEISRGHYILEPSCTDGRYLKATSENEDEYFIFECRDSSGWDRHIGGAGMLIYHIDRTDTPAGESSAYGSMTAASRWEKNQINCNPGFECAELIEATEDADDIARIFWPQEGRTTYGSGSHKPFRFRNGGPGRYALTGISFDQESRTVSFDVIEPVSIGEINCFQNSVIVNWTVDSLLRDGRESSICWHLGQDTLGMMSIQPREDSCFTCTLENLAPGTVYELSIGISHEGEEFFSSQRFKTKTYVYGTFPFIKLGLDNRNPDGSFIAGSRIPLIVDNSRGRDVVWTFDGETVTIGPDGYYTLTKSGILRAEVIGEDGDNEIIIKEITVK